VTVLSDILGADPAHRPGVPAGRGGSGGGCLPRDIRAFAARAAELGADGALGFLREMDAAT
jgi:UDPglucose 6-dehydrogenase